MGSSRRVKQGQGPLNTIQVAMPGTPQSLGMEAMSETAQMEAVGSIIAAGQQAKTEILANMFPIACRIRKKKWNDVNLSRWRA